MTNFGKQTFRMMLLAGLMAAGGAFADTLNIALKPGWNFIGLPGEMSVQELQKANPMISDVAVLRQGLIVNAMWNNVQMARGEGVAVYATGKTTLTLTIPDLPKGRALARADTITLPAGISALALPVATTVSPRIFGDRAVLAWENNGWSAYPNAAAKRYGYANAPALKALKPGQGFLVIGDTPLSANISDLTSQLQPFAGTAR